MTNKKKYNFLIYTDNGLFIVYDEENQTFILKDGSIFDCSEIECTVENIEKNKSKLLITDFGNWGDAYDAIQKYENSLKTKDYRNNKFYIGVIGACDVGPYYTYVYLHGFKNVWYLHKNFKLSTSAMDNESSAYFDTREECEKLISRFQDLDYEGIN